MESFLREWRQDALNKAQYESAIFIGDKLLALTSSFRPIYTLFYPVISCLIFILSLSLSLSLPLPPLAVYRIANRSYYISSYLGN